MSEGSNLQAAFARLEGVVTTEIKHLSHDVKNLNAKLDAYPTRRDLEAVSDRVEDLEDRHKWLWRTGFSFALTVLASAIAAYLKFGS